MSEEKGERPLSRVFGRRWLAIFSPELSRYQICVERVFGGVERLADGARMPKKRTVASDLVAKHGERLRVATAAARGCSGGGCIGCGGRCRKRGCSGGGGGSRQWRRDGSCLHACALRLLLCFLRPLLLLLLCFVPSCVLRLSGCMHRSRVCVRWRIMRRRRCSSE